MREGWQEVRLGEAITLHYGKPMRDVDRVAGEVPVVGSAGIFGWHNEANVRTSSSIIVGRKGTAGSVTWFDGRVWATDTSYWVEPEIESSLEFLYLLLQNADLPGMTAQTGVPGLNRDRVYSAQVLLPPLEEQQRIVDLIGSLDDALEAADASSDAIAAGTAQSRDALFSLYPVMSVGNLLSGISAGKSPSASNEPPKKGEYGVLKVSAVHETGFRPEEAKTVSNPGIFSPSMSVRANDVLITRANTTERVGLVCMVEKDHPNLFLCDKTLRLTPVPGVDPACLTAALQTGSVRAQLQGFGTGTSGSMKNITQDSIRSVEIQWPQSIDDQRSLGNLLSAFRQSKLSADAYADTLRATRAELLSVLLSGEHEIPESYDVDTAVQLEPAA